MEEIQARLSVKDITGMDKRKFKALIKWIRNIADEMETEGQVVYAKNPKFTLYK